MGWVWSQLGPRWLRPAEINYSTKHKEILAFVFGMLHFHEFLAPAPLVILTHNMALIDVS